VKKSGDIDSVVNYLYIEISPAIDATVVDAHGFLCCCHLSGGQGSLHVLGDRKQHQIDDLRGVIHRRFIACAFGSWNVDFSGIDVVTEPHEAECMGLRFWSKKCWHSVQIDTIPAEGFAVIICVK
jgi:hypothetical protein